MLHKTKKTESLIKSSYTVHTKDERVVVYITLIKNNENWEATALEIVEVIPNE